ncbi:MAG: Uncharacterised protein [Pseudidiomarina mangrovi]|nr:MAG: Uncharacterised protein [Pseudidiomarina mangrovi]
MNAVSKSLSLVATLSSLLFTASASSSTAWWQIPSQWPLTQPLQQLNADVQQGWALLQCQHGSAVQLWLPAQTQQLSTFLQRLAAWPEHPLAGFASCLQVRWYHANEVHCELHGERQRLHCELPLLPSETSSTHLVFAEQGIASAAGDYQINLPLNASINLLAHELAHTLGLADEYPLTGAIAHNYCMGRYDHPSLNVVVTTEKQLSSVELEALWRRLPWQFAVADWRDLGQSLGDDQWLLGSAANSIGLHAIETCNIVGKYAWRPVDYLTAMHYVDVYSWPQLYLELIERNSGL